MPDNPGLPTNTLTVLSDTSGSSSSALGLQSLGLSGQAPSSSSLDAGTLSDTTASASDDEGSTAATDGSTLRTSPADHGGSVGSESGGSAVDSVAVSGRSSAYGDTAVEGHPTGPGSISSSTEPSALQLDSMKVKALRVVLMLTADLDGEDEKDKGAFGDNLLGPTHCRTGDVSKKNERTHLNEVHLVVMRLLSVFMSRTNFWVQILIFVLPDFQLQQRPFLLSSGAVDYCPHAPEVSPLTTGRASRATRAGGYQPALKPHPTSSPPDMSPSSSARVLYFLLRSASWWMKECLPCAAAPLLRSLRHPNSLSTASGPSAAPSSSSGQSGSQSKSSTKKSKKEEKDKDKEGRSPVAVPLRPYPPVVAGQPSCNLLICSRNSKKAQQELLLDLMWSIWPEKLPPLTDAKLLSLSISRILPPEDSSDREEVQGIFQKAVEILRTQNHILTNHPELQFYLQVRPDKRTSNFPPLKWTLVTTTTQQVVKLIGSHNHQKVTVKIGDLKRTKMVRTINLYYNNRNREAIVELKNKEGPLTEAGILVIWNMEH
ncbi:unnamed protein product [Ranitomeya imitator]|uniref:Uncharacterized protein n=1 Tax=Ranitomeya imitator TaxID=111125 RepID=A0ABN9M1E3_9NEOB|nr:unnamed protein product [Ranitomeya imitator]